MLPMNPEPFRIEPTFSPRIWGARSLAPIFPEKTNLAEPIGEAWLTDVNCRIATGPFAGEKLGEAWREMPAEWRGAKLAGVRDFPLLVKFLFPTDKLSIQVHPDDAYASVHERAAGGRGKTEMWHVMSTDPGAHVLLGLKAGTTKEKFVAALEANTLETLFVSVPVSAGDTIFVPARTGHAICPGMVLCEVQEYSDLTYRVYDYGRLDAHGNPRELHLEKALEVMDFSAVPPGKVPPLPLAPGASSPLLVAACRYFATERWSFDASQEPPLQAGRFTLVVVLEGHGSLACGNLTAKYRLGECWFVPASDATLRFHPATATTLLRAYVPDLPALRDNLKGSGVSESQVSRVVFE